MGEEEEGEEGVTRWDPGYGDGCMVASCWAVGGGGGTAVITVWLHVTGQEMFSQVGWSLHGRPHLDCETHYSQRSSLLMATTHQTDMDRTQKVHELYINTTFIKH